MKHLLLSLFSLSLCIAGIAQNRKDTVKVIALVCDTADKQDLPAPFNNNTSYHKVHNVFWMEIYEVRNVEYLDANKKPLKKSIIVWQTKNL